MAEYNSKAEKIDAVKSNLPLPDQPPVASDFNSSDARTVNVGSGGDAADNPQLRSSAGMQKSPATGDSAVRNDGETYKTNTAGLGVGRTAADGLDKPPSDAVTQDKKGTTGTTGTTKADYGYPQQNDPSSGVDGPTRREG